MTAPRFLPWLVGAGLAATAFVVYLPALSHDFVLWDDTIYVTDNENVQAGLTPSSIAWAFTATEVCQWHPVTWLSHMTDVSLFGMHPGSLHGVNVLFHAVNTALLFFVLWRMTDALWRSAFVAAAFALHPMHVESVAWIAERKDVLSAFFMFLALWAYAWYVRKESRGRYALVVAWFAIGLMAKSMIITLPCVLLLLDYWPLRRLRFSRDTLGMNAKLAAPYLVEKAPLFGIAAAMAIITVWVQREGGCVRETADVSWQASFANAWVAYATYIWRMFWPVDLAALYPFPQTLPVWKIGASLVLLGGVTVAAITVPKQHYFIVGWLWYLGMLVPVIGFIPIGVHAMADRYTYLPYIGLFMIIAWGAPELLRKVPHSRAFLTGIALVALMALGIRTWDQVQVWRNSETLFTHTLELAPQNPKIHNNYAAYLLESGDLEAAKEQFIEALRYAPGLTSARNNLGVVYLRQGAYAEAARQFRRVLRVEPGHAEAQENLSRALEGLAEERSPRR